MKKKIFLIIISIFFIIYFFPIKTFLLTNKKKKLFPETINIGYFFEKNPFFYYNNNKNRFEGKDISLLNFILKSFNNKYKLKFIKIDLDNIPDNLDIILGGIIYSDYLNNITKNYIKINYFNDSVLLLRNKYSKSITFDNILKNKIVFGVKLYSLGFYLFDDISFIKKFAFYKDMLFNLNRNSISYAIMDKNDLKYVNLNKYKNIVIEYSIYNEKYVFLLNFKYANYQYLFSRLIDKYKGESDD